MPTRDGVTRRTLIKGTGAGLTTLAAGCTTDGQDTATPEGGGGSTATTATTTTAAEGTGGTPTPNRNEVHFLTDYSSDAWQDKWENEIVPEFEEQTGIPLNIEYVGFQGTGEQRLTTLLQAGDAPESFTGAITQIGDFVAKGQTTDLTGTIEAIEEENGDLLYQSTVTVAEKAHIVPNGLYLGGAFNYRRDIYEQLGLEVPETWSELLHNAQVIDESDEVEERGFAMPAPKAGKSGSEFSLFLANAGGGMWQWEEEGERVELWFEEDHVVSALETMRELAQYSPDPSSVNWGPTIQFWTGSRIAQCNMNNAWLAGPPLAAGNEQVAAGTDVAPVPMREGSDPIDRGWALLDGHPVLSESDNVQGAKELLKFMYRGPENQADKQLIEPMRFLPPYESVVETDLYRSAEVFQALDGHLFDLNQKCIEEIAPNLQNPDRPTTPATIYVSRFPIDSEMVNQVLVQDRDPQNAYQDAVERFEQRLQEGRELAEI